MRACLVLCVAAALVGAACSECDACIDGQCYRKHRLLGARERSIGIDRYTNTSYYVDEKGTLIKCHLATEICNDTNNKWDIGRIAVDQNTGDIYGLINGLGSRSLFKMDLINNTKELLIRGVLFDLAFKDKLYYSKWFDRGVYTFEDGESRVVAGTERYRVYNFIVHREDDIYFFTHIIDRPRLVVRRLSKGFVDETIYCDSSYLMTLDGDRRAVFINPATQALYRATNGKLIEFGVLNVSIHEIGTPWFDGDNNLIYRDKSRNYYYLKRDRDVLQCTN